MARAPQYLGLGSFNPTHNSSLAGNALHACFLILEKCRKSTAGFNIGQMILDLAGGILSLFQLALEAIVLKDASLITGQELSLAPVLLPLLFFSNRYPA